MNVFHSNNLQPQKNHPLFKVIKSHDNIIFFVDENSEL